jgi:hypothetical protein
MSRSSRGKKLVAAFICAAAFVGAANAFIVVNFNSVGGYVGFGQDALVANLINGGLTQVIWSGDDVIDPLNMGTATPTGDDVVLMSEDNAGDPLTSSFYLGAFGQISAADGAGIRFSENNNPMDQATFLAGNIYLRVFDVANPTLNDHYVSGSQLGVSQIWGGLTGDTGGVVAPGDEEQIDISRSPDAVDGEFGAKYVALDMTIVPEPTTFALFGLGLATLAARRKFRK